MMQSKLYKSLEDLGAFRIEDLPASVRQRPYLAQDLHYLESKGRLRRVRRGAYIVVPADEIGRPVETTDRFIAATMGSYINFRSRSGGRNSGFGMP